MRKFCLSGKAIFHEKTLPVTSILPFFCFTVCNNHQNTPPPDNPFGLPNTTLSGPGAFACSINGENAFAKNVIKQTGGSTLNNTKAVKGQFTTGRFFTAIYSGLQNNTMENIASDLSDTLHTYCFYVTDSTWRDISQVSATKPAPGIFFSKTDLNKKILSDTFNGKAPFTVCDTLNVTDGSFDFDH